jgi:broad specificity phosphatase PhoE
MHAAQLVCEQLALPTDQIRPDPRLIEVSFGQWEKQNMLELHAQQPHLAALPDWYFQAPDGEAYADVVARLETWLADPLLPNNLIVVAHGLLGRIFRGVYAKMTPEAMWAQDMPQDAFFRLNGGKIAHIDCMQLVE